MKLIHSILLLPLIGSACSPTHSTRYIIEGEGVDSTQNGKYLYLQRYDDRSIVDSAQVVKQRYVFHGDIDTAVYCYIDTKSWSTAQFMLEPGTIRIHTENRNSSVKGTVQNDSRACWNAKTDSLLAEPFLLLLSPDGIMVARNLRGEKMTQLVKQLLDKEQSSGEKQQLDKG